jgi:2-phosphosulfolactate phosphatase
MAKAARILVFPTLEQARAAHAGCREPKLLAGEERCLRPAGFDLGNSPGDFLPEDCAGRTIFFSTTNGTRALAAAREAKSLFAAALVNATVTAQALLAEARDVTLLCAGTNGSASAEDLIGAGAVLSAMLAKESSLSMESDLCQIALDVFNRNRERGFVEAFGRAQGGANLLAAGLERDLHFAARLDACPVLAKCDGRDLSIVVATDAGV